MWLQGKASILERKGRSQALVAHTYNPSYSVGRDQEDKVQSQPGEIVHETLS
jgi:hypothetical protein